MELLYLPLLVLFLSQGSGLSIDTKLDLPSINSDGIPYTMDSSLSPKIVKAFYEINFVQVPKVDPHKSHITITDTKGCPYSNDLCKFYFAPSKVSLVEKIDDLIKESKKDLSTDVPVIQGVAITDEEKLLKDLSPKINTRLKKTKAIPRHKDSDDVPVYRGTVNVDGVLKTPEVSTLPDYKPHYPEIKRQCFQGLCWRTYY